MRHLILIPAIWLCLISAPVAANELAAYDGVWITCNTGKEQLRIFDGRFSYVNEDNRVEVRGRVQTEGERVFFLTESIRFDGEQRSDDIPRLMAMIAAGILPLWLASFPGREDTQAECLLDVKNDRLRIQSRLEESWTWRDMHVYCRAEGPPARRAHEELPTGHWTFGSSLVVLTPFLFGNINDYLSFWVWGLGFEFPVSNKNVVIIPSATIVAGSITTPFSYDCEDWDDSFASLRLDLSLGYRINLSPKLFFTPKGGLGLLNIWEHPENATDSINIDTFLGFTPTTSVGIALEYLSRTLVFDIRLALGVDYRYFLHAWEDRFRGSELMIWVSAGLVNLHS